MPTEFRTGTQDYPQDPFSVTPELYGEAARRTISTPMGTATHWIGLVPLASPQYVEYVGVDAGYNTVDVSAVIGAGKMRLLDADLVLTRTAGSGAWLVTYQPQALWSARVLLPTAENFTGTGLIRHISTRTGEDGTFRINFNHTLTNIRSATYRWILSAGGTNEYYVELAAGGNPTLTNPTAVYLNSVKATEGSALGSLAAGEWKVGNNDALGFNTVYVRLADGTDPDSKASGWVETSTQTYRVSVYVNFWLPLEI
jgi:hypothetical protein